MLWAKVRREVWREAHQTATQAAREHPRGKGRPGADNADALIVAAVKAKADEIKNAAYTLGKASVHLTEKQHSYFKCSMSSLFSFFLPFIFIYSPK